MDIVFLLFMFNPNQSRNPFFVFFLDLVYVDNPVAHRFSGSVLRLRVKAAYLWRHFVLYSELIEHRGGTAPRKKIIISNFWGFNFQGFNFQG